MKNIFLIALVIFFVIQGCKQNLETVDTTVRFFTVLPNGDRGTTHFLIIDSIKNEDDIDFYHHPIEDIYNYLDTVSHDLPIDDVIIFSGEDSKKKWESDIEYAEKKDNWLLFVGFNKSYFGKGSELPLISYFSLGEKYKKLDIDLGYYNKIIQKKYCSKNDSNNVK